MHSRPTDKQLSKLPKHVQTYIRGLERERDNALEVMRKIEDDQTPTKIRSRDFECLGEQRGPTEVVRYFDADRLEIEQNGVRLTIDGLWKDDEDICLSWHPSGEGHAMGDIAMIPVSNQRVRLSNIAYNEREYERLTEQRERSERKKAQATA
jgi:hypothetical protein